MAETTRVARDITGAAATTEEIITAAPAGSKRQTDILYPDNVATLVTLLGMSFMTRALTNSTTQEIPYSQFLKMLDEGQIAEVEITDDQINITPKTEDGKASLLMSYYTGLVYDPGLVERLEKPVWIIHIPYRTVPV